MKRINEKGGCGCNWTTWRWLIAYQISRWSLTGSRLNKRERGGKTRWITPYERKESGDQKTNGGRE